MAHTLGLDELFVAYYVCRIQQYARTYPNEAVVCDIYVYAVYSYKLLVPYMYNVTAVVYGLEKMERCLCHILFFKSMIDWKSFYANGGYSNGNSDPLSYENGYDDNDEEYTDIMREEWHRRMKEE